MRGAAIHQDPDVPGEGVPSPLEQVLAPEVQVGLQPDAVHRGLEAADANVTHVAPLVVNDLLGGRQESRGDKVGGRGSAAAPTRPAVKLPERA